MPIPGLGGWSSATPLYVGAGIVPVQVVAPRNTGNLGEALRFIADITGVRTRDGGAVTLWNESGLIHLGNSHAVHFIGFRMENSSGNAIYNGVSSQVVLEDCVIVSGGASVHGGNRTAWTIRGTSITAANGHAVYIETPHWIFRIPP